MNLIHIDYSNILACYWIFKFFHIFTLMGSRTKVRGFRLKKKHGSISFFSQFVQLKGIMNWNIYILFNVYENHVIFYNETFYFPWTFVLLPFDPLHFLLDDLLSWFLQFSKLLVQMIKIKMFPMKLRQNAI